MTNDLSFGIIPLQKREGEWWVFLVYHKKGFWGFPKGHAESGEEGYLAACRELTEETGLVVERRISNEVLEEKYSYPSARGTVKKRVVYYIASVVGEILLQPEEIVEGAWVPVENAEDRITFQEGRLLCQNLVLLLQQQNGKSR